jgi:CRISPR-associated endonuclease/helicase Cas3
MLAEKWRAQGYQGMYMALPTMATSESLYERYNNDYLKKLRHGDKARLVHGMAWLRDDKEPEKTLEVGEIGDDQSLAAAWFRPTRRAMLAEHGVGTIDQAMLAGMNVKFGFLRLYGLTRKVLVIDEVHAYDAYMSAIIARLLQWCACLRIPVILLSATLSATQRAKMVEAYRGSADDLGPDAPYPLITAVDMEKNSCQQIHTEALSSKTIKIEMHQGYLEDANRTAAKAEELVKQGGCCCVILNTVKQAQAVYQALTLSDDEKLLFHARFSADDRKQKAEDVIKRFGKARINRPQKFVLVATQVVEQSLDVDFDYMISDIAPIDLLLQRSGRLHRHFKRDHIPVLHVLLPEEKSLNFGGTSYIYAEKPLRRTLAVLSSEPEIYLPQDFRTLIERCYGSQEWEQNSVPWVAIRKADQDWDKETQSLYDQGHQFALCEPSKRMFRPVNNDPSGDDSDDGNGWRAKTRLGANDYTAILVREEQLQHLEPGELLMREICDLYRQSVRLPCYLPIHSPAKGYSAGVEGKNKLRGLIMLPVSDAGLWQGTDEKGNCYEVSYGKEFGLLVRRLL